MSREQDADNRAGDCALSLSPAPLELEEKALPAGPLKGFSLPGLLSLGEGGVLRPGGLRALGAELGRQAYRHRSWMHQAPPLGALQGFSGREERAEYTYFPCGMTSKTRHSLGEGGSQTCGLHAAGTWLFSINSLSSSDHAWLL